MSTSEALFDTQAKYWRLRRADLLDSLSDAAAEKKLASWRNRQTPALRDDGIDVTPEIEAALRTDEMMQYLDGLVLLVDKEVETSRPSCAGSG